MRPFSDAGPPVHHVGSAREGAVRPAPQSPAPMLRDAPHRVVNFHGIGIPHDRVPEDEVPFWLSQDRFAAIARQIAALRSEGHDIRITFDDGNLSDLQAAAPVLESLGLRAEFFVLTGRLDQPDYLSPDAVRALLGMGHGIGLHGHAHLDWRRLDAAGLRSETVLARSRLEAVAGGPVRRVAIPFGSYARRVIAHLRAEGFAVIYTSDGGTTSDRDTVRARTSLRADMDEAAVTQILTGRVSLPSRLRRRISSGLRQHVW